MVIPEEFLDSLEYQWSGEVQLNNGLIISIWWTAWPQRRGKIHKVVNVYSDFPKVKIH